MARPYNLDQLLEMRGHTVYDNEGGKIGQVDNIFYDDSTNEPEWIGVSTGTIMKSHHLVPLDAASIRGDDIQISYAKDFVNDSPEVEGDHIEPDQERDLYNYYNLQRDERFASQDAPEFSSEPAPDATDAPIERGEQSMTRHEEEMRVGKREVEGGRARLRKWVETEPRSEDVTLRRERAEVHREPINEPAPGAEMRDEDVEMTLREEEPVIEKETMARERIDLGREEEMVDETVSGEVRRERVEVEGDDDRSRGFPS